VILRHDQWHRVFAIGQDEERYLRSTETLFQNDSRSGIAKAAVVHRRENGRFGLGTGLGNDHTLASGEPVDFHYRRWTKVSATDDRNRFADVATDLIARRGDPMAPHEVFREGLAGLQLRRQSTRAKDWAATSAEEVGNAASQRRFGSDDCEVYWFGLGQSQHGLRVGGIDHNRSKLSSDSGVTGSTDDAIDSRLPGEFAA